MRSAPSSFIIRCVLMLSVGLTALNLAALAYRFPVWPALIVTGLTYRRLKRRRNVSDAYGSARPLTLRETWKEGLLGDHGIILGTCGYMDRPTVFQGIRALFSFVPSTLACRMFFAAFLGRSWLDS